MFVLFSDVSGLSLYVNSNGTLLVLFACNKRFFITTLFCTFKAQIFIKDFALCANMFRFPSLGKWFQTFWACDGYP